MPNKSGLRQLRAITDKDGRFKSERGAAKTIVFAEANNRKLAGIVELSEERGGAIVKIAPTATGKARLLNAKTKKPMANEQIDFGIRIEYEEGTFSSYFGGSVKTDKKGLFAVNGLVPGHEYTLNLVTDRDADGRPRSWSRVARFTAEKAGVVDFGDVYYQGR